MHCTAAVRADTQPIAFNQHTRLTLPPSRKYLRPSVCKHTSTCLAPNTAAHLNPPCRPEGSTCGPGPPPAHPPRRPTPAAQSRTAPARRGPAGGRQHQTGTCDCRPSMSRATQMCKIWPTKCGRTVHGAGLPAWQTIPCSRCFAAHFQIQVGRPQVAQAVQPGVPINHGQRLLLVLLLHF